jgi:hypothetical protein
MVRQSKKDQEIELHLDAWKRFERAVDVTAKAPPLHRAAKKKKSPKKTKKAHVKTR